MLADAQKNLKFELTYSDFKFFSSVLYKVAGIVMSDAKQGLVQNRIKGRLFDLGFNSYKEYRTYLESLDGSDPEWRLFINCLTTNKTDFFREPKHFDHLLNNVIGSYQGRKLKIWSAACSTGEEPYSLAMSLNGKCEFEILATDIDTKVLSTASKGVYERNKVITQMSDEFAKANFLFGTGEISGWAKVKPDLKKTIQFAQFNLIESYLDKKNKFDIIFLRNVLIYFDANVIELVISKLTDSLKPSGYLYIGHSESLGGINHNLKSVQPSVFQKKAA